MDLFRKCMEPVEKCLRDAKMDKSTVRSGAAKALDCLFMVEKRMGASKSCVYVTVVLMGAQQAPAGLTEFISRPCVLGPAKASISSPSQQMLRLMVKGLLAWLLGYGTL